MGPLPLPSQLVGKLEIENVDISDSRSKVRGIAET